MNDLGYIIVTLSNGRLKPINIRSILKYEWYKYEKLPNINSRIWFLDKSFVSVCEDTVWLDKEILKITLK